ncbi:MAG: AAA family ATPase [Pseudomonadota bacterium]
MPKKTKKRPTQHSRESLHIRAGRLGPLEPQSLDISPLTLLIGGQGTGKSLVAQSLYLFRALPQLVHIEATGRILQQRRRQAARVDLDRIVEKVIDGLRSPRRRFANLTHPNVTLEWEGVHSIDGLDSQPRTLGFNAQYATRQVQLRKSLKELAEEVTDSRANELGALFLPSERLLFAMLPDPSIHRAIGLPLLFEAFVRAVNLLYDAATDQSAEPDVTLANALGGYVRRTPTTWRWVFADKYMKRTRTIDLDMASSGQRAAGILEILGPGLTALRTRGALAEPFTLYLEEPEIHLHPEAERLVVEMLATLVRAGFRVVVTTHSLTVLYAVNNLLLRTKLREIDSTDGLYLEPQEVAAYHLQNGIAKDLLEENPDFIDESALGTVADDLQGEMNRIAIRLHDAGSLDGSTR